jgi:hypothetical protein
MICEGFSCFNPLSRAFTFMRKMGDLLGFGCGERGLREMGGILRLV